MDRSQFSQEAEVFGNDGGMIGTLLSIDEDSEPISLVLRHARDGRHVRIPWHQIDHAESSPDRIVVDVPGAALLESQAPGAEEAGGVDEATVATPDATVDDHITMPLAEEELVVNKHDVELGRIVVRKRVETVPHEASIDVEHEEIDVERVAIGRNVDTAPSVRHEGDTLIVPVVEEVLVVEKRLRLVEEVRITRRRVSEERVIREDLRREEVDVVQDDAPSSRDEP